MSIASPPPPRPRTVSTRETSPILAPAATAPTFPDIQINTIATPRAPGRYRPRQKKKNPTVIIACVAGAVLFGIVLLSVIANSSSLLGGPMSAARMKAQIRRDLAAQNSGVRAYIT